MVSENLEQALIPTVREVRLLRQKYLPVDTFKHIHRRGPVQDGFLSIEPRHPTASQVVYKGWPMAESIASPTQENPRFRKQRREECKENRIPDYASLFRFALC